MCQFLSIVSDIKGKIYLFNSQQRKELSTQNYYRLDLHASICEYYDLKEDNVNKYEVDIFPKIVVKVDQINIKDDTDMLLTG